MIELTDAEKMECVARWLNGLYHAHTNLVLHEENGVVDPVFLSFLEEKSPVTLPIAQAGCRPFDPCSMCPIWKEKCSEYAEKFKPRFMPVQTRNWKILEQFVGEPTIYQIARYYDKPEDIKAARDNILSELFDNLPTDCNEDTSY